MVVLSNQFQLGKMLLCLPFALYVLVESQAGASAQVVSDTTLPNNSIVTSNGNTIEITGGTTSGHNLFHSFEQFSVLTGNTAVFNNAAAIENIISRVTGDSVSNINGLIRANGTANLFLLNPNGIIFGPNASLDIGGSFIGSTADSLEFSDGSEFSAVDPQAPPLLTLNVPTGLQYGANPGDITVQGPGNHLFLNSDESVNRADRPVGLQVNPGQTLALVGGDVSLQGGNLTAAGGRIELGSVGGVGVVRLAADELGWALDYENVNDWQNIRLSQAASLEVSGNSGGHIRVWGQNVSLTGASAMLADTLGDGSRGSLNIRATDTVNVTGFSSPRSTSRISSDVAPGATGDGGGLRISARRLRVADGAQITTETFSSGNAGTLRVIVQELDIVGASPIGPSGLFTLVEPDATGQGGALTVKTERLRIADGGQIASSTFGRGNAGALTIDANEIELIGTSASNFSGLFANTEEEATGKGGALTIITDRLRILDGAQIIVSTFGEGNAGELTVRDSESIEAIGGSPRGPSGLFTASQRGTGNGGDLTIETDRLRLVNGGQIAAATRGSGNAGELTVRASESIELVGYTDQGRSGLFTIAVNGNGEGGNLAVFTDRLIVRDGAIISASNFPSNPALADGTGPAGNIDISAQSIQLENGGSITASTQEGGRGNIRINSQILAISGNTLIATDSQGREPGGNIGIDTTYLLAQDNSDITANADNANGGRVTISAQGIFGTEFQEDTTLESDITASSNRGAEFNGIVQLNTPEVDPSQVVVTLPNTLVDSSTQIAATCSGTVENRFVVTGRGGLPEQPTQILRDSTVWEDLRLATRGEALATTEGEQERGGHNLEPENAVPTSQIHTGISHVPLPTPHSPLIEAQGWVINSNGHVVLVSQVPEGTSNQSWYQPAQCGQS
jgi:filamentous hemagglutinin family protein